MASSDNMLADIFTHAIELEDGTVVDAVIEKPVKEGLSECARCQGDCEHGRPFMECQQDPNKGKPVPKVLGDFFAKNGVQNGQA